MLCPNTMPRIIFDELGHGQVVPASPTVYRRIAEQLLADGAKGVIAGCTEIDLLPSPSDVSVRYYPTASVHVDAAVDWLLGT